MGAVPSQIRAFVDSDCEACYTPFELSESSTKGGRHERRLYPGHRQRHAERAGAAVRPARQPASPSPVSPSSPISQTQPGWAEQHPEYFWESLCQACQQLWQETDVPKEAIAGVALTTQRATMVNVDRAGQPLRPAIVWLDQRRTEGLQAGRRAVGRWPSSWRA